MDRQEYISLFESMHPDFFEREYIRSLSDECVYDEMLLPLDEFDPHIYETQSDSNISYGYYDGDWHELRKTVEMVDTSWTRFYDGRQRAYCGYVNKKAVSFCLVEDMGTHVVNGRKLKIGGPGCVGTLPECRHRGIGLTMVRNVTQILKDEGFDYSYIHFTGVAPWYEKLGYKTAIRWGRNGIF